MDAESLVMLGVLLAMLPVLYGLRQINQSECLLKDSIELICNYKGNVNYDSVQIQPMIETITFPTFGLGQIIVSERHFPDLKNINIQRIPDPLITETDVCKNIRTHNGVVTTVVATVCKTESEYTTTPTTKAQVVGITRRDYNTSAVRKAFTSIPTDGKTSILTIRIIYGVVLAVILVGALLLYLKASNSGKYSMERFSCP